MLGSKRDGTLIPWDDDIDIGVYHRPGEEKEIIERIQKQITDTYYVEDFPFFGCKIHHRHLNIFIDIFFFTTATEDAINYTFLSARSAWPRAWFMNNEIYQLESCCINGKQYKCPSNTSGVLQRWYGEDCIETPRLTHLHDVSFYDSQIVSTCSRLGMNRVR